MPTTVLLITLGLFGLLVGSFLNVVIVRVPSDESIVRPPSKCPGCGHAIRPRDNIPVISWVLLMGKCRDCKEPIPAGYPLVELANAVLWVLAGMRFGATWPTVAYALLFSALLALSVIDLELYILPNKITYPLLAASVIGVIPLSFTQSDPTGKMLGAWLTGVLYALALAVPAALLSSILGRSALGMGDVKLAPTLGIWIGWLHPFLLFYAIILAAFSGLVAGLVMWVIRRKRAEIPFGPWLAFGTIVTVMASTGLAEKLVLTVP